MEKLLRYVAGFVANENDFKQSKTFSENSQVWKTKVLKKFTYNASFAQLLKNVSAGQKILNLIELNAFFQSEHLCQKNTNEL